MDERATQAEIGNQCDYSKERCGDRHQAEFRRQQQPCEHDCLQQLQSGHEERRGRGPTAGRKGFLLEAHGLRAVTK